MRKSLLIAVVIVSVLSAGALAFGQYHGRVFTGGTVTGELIIKGQGPMLGGTVFFIDEKAGTPSATKYWMVPTYAFKVDENSRFTAKLPEGTYYMGVIERKTEEVLGPPEEGDYFFISQDSKGNPKRLTVWKNSTIDLGTLDEAVPFKRSSLATKGITAIQGKVHDVHGNTIGGMMVAAYADAEMMGRPLFVSERTESDGKYLLRLPKGGTYYLMVRAGYSGGPPAPNELIGFYRDGSAVKIKTGTVRRGADITVWPAELLLE